MPAKKKVVRVKAVTGWARAGWEKRTVVVVCLDRGLLASPGTCQRVEIRPAPTKAGRGRGRKGT